MLIACAPVNLLNTLTPSGSFSKSSDVSYGELGRQNLDIYKAKLPKANSPVIVFLHGGSWRMGSKDIYKFIAEAFTSEGFDVVVPNYRLYPEVRFPDMIVDTAKAFSFITRQYPDRPLVIIGHSAGAYNALMTTMDKSYLVAEGIAACDHIAGLISLAAPTGAYELKKEPYITIFPDRFQSMDAPLAHVAAPVPSLFVMNGADDTTVGPKNAEDLTAAVQARGGHAVLKIYDGFDHIDAVKRLSRHFDGGTTYKADILDFIDGLPKNGNFCR